MARAVRARHPERVEVDVTSSQPPERRPDTFPQALRSMAAGLWWLTLVAVLPTRRLKTWAEEHIEALVDEIEERRCSR
jgi:hypothetical protein